MPILSSAKVRNGTFRPSATLPRDGSADQRTIEFLVQARDDPDHIPATLERLSRELAKEREEILHRAQTMMSELPPARDSTTFDQDALGAHLNQPTVDDLGSRGALGGEAEAAVGEVGGGRDTFETAIGGRSNVKHGTIKWYNSTKGYGFIQPDDGGQDVFVHASAVENAGLHGLGERSKVEYEVERKTGSAEKVVRLRPTN